MDPILGIDLGTTNSAVSIIEDGKPKVLCSETGENVLPSVVGLERDGHVLVGVAAQNQALVAPERTVRSIKRSMGSETTVQLGEREFSPQEISAIILRTLKDRAAKAFGRPLTKAVITVPAFFNETQREATREAGELAGLEVVRIINEPTAASLTYEPHSENNERLLVYDLGGGTFDVSVVQIEQGVVEVLSSHGDTNLGGDDFDQLLLDHVCDAFARENQIDLRQMPAAHSRMLQAIEAAKKRLSDEAFTTIAEEFIAEKDGKPLNLQIEISRDEYEALIEPLLKKTLTSVDEALNDAHITAAKIDRVILAGGSTRTPLVRRLLEGQLHNELHSEIDADLCVAMGAAVQGGLIAGIDVGPVLVDITPHTLGVECRGELHGRVSSKLFSPIISRNTPLPATRSEIYYTSCEGQEQVRVRALQGENEDSRYNDLVGEFILEGMDEEADQGSEVLVRFDLNLDGILTVTAVERATGLENQLEIDNAVTRFRAKSRDEAKARLAKLFNDPDTPGLGAMADSVAASPQDGPNDDEFKDASALIAKARRVIPLSSKEDADEMRQLVDVLQQAMASHDIERVQHAQTKLDDIVFYLEEV